MKVIDLLNKIAKGEEVPEKIIYRKKEFFWCKPCNDYDYKDDTLIHLKDCVYNLNDEVEIIEEEKDIEELDILDENERYSNKMLYKKINELIKAVNELKKGK